MSNGFILALILLIFNIVLLVVSILIFVTVNKWLTYKSTLEEVQSIQIIQNLDFDKGDSILNKYIDEAGTIYKVLNFEYVDPEDVYIKEEDAQEMIRFIVKDVSSRLNPNLISLLSLSHPADMESILALIYEKTKNYVLNYVIETKENVEG